MALKVFAVLLALQCTAFAADLGSATVDYSLESWDERQGLPSGRIWAIAQDSSGYLWLGTENGLVRFDGVQFTRWTGIGEEAVVFALTSTRDGSLWIGLAEAGVVRMIDGRIERYGRPAGIGDGPVQFLFEDRQGVLWAGDRAGVHRFVATKWERLDMESGLMGGAALDAHEDRAGNLWISTASGIYRKDLGAASFRYVRAERPLDFSEDPSGILWITDPRRGFSKIDSRGGTEPVPPGSGAAIVHDRHGTMWVGTQGQGLWRINQSGSAGTTAQQMAVSEGLSSNVVRSVFEDRDGNVWVGTESALHRFTRRKAMSMTDIGFTWAAQSAGGKRLWISTGDGLVEVSGSHRRRYGVQDGLPSAFIRALTTDARGRLWLGTDRGLARRRDDGRFEAVPNAERLPSIISLAADSRGRVWICDRQRGAFIWANGHVTPIERPAGVVGVAQFVLLDREDRVWIGYPGVVVSVHSPDGSQQLHHVGSAIGSIVTAAYQSRDGAIWLGGIRGLGRIQGDTVQAISEPDVLPGFGVFSITEDLEGSLWLGISSGVLNLRVGDFERAARDPQSGLRYRFFDASDGIVGVPVRVAFPGAARLDDDTLWFTTSRGITVLSPREMDDSQSSPVVRIETAQANDRAVSPQEGTALLPGTETLRIGFTAPNLTSPFKERFRYRLVGVDNQWIDAGTRREAFYANLGSGSYRFEVGRLTRDPAPDTAFAVWSFSIQPRFYETWWFTSLCLVLLTILAWAAWQMRVRQLRRQFALVLAERARMSREIHDTVVQELLGISFHFDELAASLGTASQPFEGQITRLKRYLQAAVVEAREVVWELRSPSGEESTLPRRIREASQRAFTRRAASVEFAVLGTPRPADPATERHLFRIAQEALGNAARYADATEVVVTLEYQGESIYLEVRDNGRGLPFYENGPEPAGHYGFAIMRERAEQMGGQFHVQSAPHQGTRIEVNVPVPAL